MCGLPYDLLDKLIKDMPQAELVADYGIMGDAHAGKWHRPVSYTHLDVYKRQVLHLKPCLAEELQLSGKTH